MSFVVLMPMHIEDDFLVPGISAQIFFFCLESHPASSLAESDAFWYLNASVFVDRKIIQQSKGLGTAPVAFCIK